MNVFELMKPGTWVASSDRNLGHSIDLQLGQLVTNFVDANAALGLFEQFQSAFQAAFRVPGKWEGEQQRKREIQAALATLPVKDDFGPVSPFHRDLALIEQAEVVFLREKWASGWVPNSVQRSHCFIAARAFLFAVDNIERQLGVLLRTQGVPTELRDLHDQLLATFPTLRNVRNSAHHPEDRIRGIGSGNKKMALQPVSAGGIEAPHGGALVMGNLHGSMFGCTLGDGTFGQIDVSSASMIALQRIVQAALDAFVWQGHAEHLPQ